MPQKRTLSPGPMTSRRPLPAAAARSALLGRANEVAARFFVRLKLDQAFLRGLFEQVREGAEAVIALVESRVAPLQRLLDHRTPDALVGVALGHQRFERAEHQIESLLLLVAVRLVASGARRRGFAPLLRAAALLLVGAHQVVVVDELVAVLDQQ